MRQVPAHDALAYDALADLYDRYWGPVTVDQLLAAYDRLLLGALAPGSWVLDVGCGTGQLAWALGRRALKVIGLDTSPGMLRRAQRNAPEAMFIAADARSFGAGQGFAGALSTFDSLNHLDAMEDLESCFRHVRRALAPGGGFAFDVNTAQGYVERSGDSFGYGADDHVCLVRTGYDGSRRTASYEITIFRFHGAWQRTDVALRQWPHEVDEVIGALRRCGYAEIAYYDAESDLGLDGHCGRAFFVARRPGSTG